MPTDDTGTLTPPMVTLPLPHLDLTHAIQQTIAAAQIPSDHAFALIGDLHGSHVGFARRVGDGWDVGVFGGYTWSGPTPGADLGFSVVKTFKS